MFANQHSGSTVRKEAIAKKKVFKNAIDSPYALKWPVIPPTVEEPLLTHLLAALEPLGEYHRSRRLARSKKTKEAANAEVKEKPEISQRVHVGINAVTRFLEQCIKDPSKTKAQPARTPATFLCRRDIDPGCLCSHLLPMCGMANVKLVTLPQGSAEKLSKALGIQRTCAVLIEIEENKEESLRLQVNDVPSVNIPWLSAAVYQPTQVKIIETTAPVQPPKKRPQPEQPGSTTKKAKR